MKKLTTTKIAKPSSKQVNDRETTLSIKFLIVLLYKNLLWKDHIKYTENKVSKNIGILYIRRDNLSKQSLLSLCLYSYIRKLYQCSYIMGKYDKNKLKENPPPAKARHFHYLS